MKYISDLSNSFHNCIHHGCSNQYLGRLKKIFGLLLCIFMPWYSVWSIWITWEVVRKSESWVPLWTQQMNPGLHFNKILYIRMYTSKIISVLIGFFHILLSPLHPVSCILCDIFKMHKQLYIYLSISFILKTKPLTITNNIQQGLIFDYF